MQVWLNGEFTARDEAKVSVFDAGFQHGVGLFETMLARNGVAFRAEPHMNRLAASAKELLLSDRLRIEPLVEAVHHTLRRNDLKDARVRLSVTGGDLNMLQSRGQSPVDPTVLIVAQPPTEYPPAFFEKGVMATIADARENPFNPMAGHKTLNYWPRIQSLQQAAAKRGGESLWFGVSNHLCGGSVSNAFIVKGGELFTPIARGEEQPGAMRSPTLPGITRAAVIEIAETLDIAVERRMLDINDVLQADEVFLTNSSWGVLPVVAVEREKIADGSVGEVTAQIRRAWLDLVEEETRWDERS